MSRAKRKRKARLAARKQVASERLLASIAHSYARAIEKALARDPERVLIGAARAYDQGTVTTWLLTEHPYKQIYRNVARGWLATTRSPRDPRKRLRVNRRDMRRLNRTEARADALKARREWAELRANKRSWRRVDERMGFDAWGKKGKRREAPCYSPLMLGLGGIGMAVVAYNALKRPSHAGELAAIAERAAARAEAR